MARPKKEDVIINNEIKNEDIKNDKALTIDEIEQVEDKKEQEQNIKEVNIKKVEILEKKWEPDLHRMICVKNIARGKLVYKSKRQNGYEIVWENTNDENYMELAELVNLKNANKRFITEPWIRINEPDEVEILKYLGIHRYYEKIIDVDVDKILTLSPDRFERKFKNLPNSFKQAIAGRAAEMIKSGELDSLKIKNIIEKEMDIDLSFYARE